MPSKSLLLCLLGLLAFSDVSSAARVMLSTPEGAKTPLLPVPEPFFVSAAPGTVSIAFHDAAFAGYNLVCRAADGSERPYGATLSTKDDAYPPLDSDIVFYQLSFAAHKGLKSVAGKYVCDFKRAPGAPVRSVAFVIPEAGTVPTAPLESIVKAKTTGTTIVFPALKLASKYFASCRAVDDCIPVAVSVNALERHAASPGAPSPPGSYGPDSTPEMVLSAATTKPGKHECVIYATNWAGAEGEKSLVQFEVDA
jgi:hypothetical protein